MKKKYILLVKHAPNFFHLSLKTLIVDLPGQKLFLTLKLRHILSGSKCRRAHIGLGPPNKAIVSYAVGYVPCYFRRWKVRASCGVYRAFFYFCHSSSSNRRRARLIYERLHYDWLFSLCYRFALPYRGWRSFHEPQHRRSSRCNLMMIGHFPVTNAKHSDIYNQM